MFQSQPKRPTFKTLSKVWIVDPCRISPLSWAYGEIRIFMGHGMIPKFLESINPKLEHFPRVSWKPNIIDEIYGTM